MQKWDLNESLNNSLWAFTVITHIKQVCVLFSVCSCSTCQFSLRVFLPAVDSWQLETTMERSLCSGETETPEWPHVFIRVKVWWCVVNDDCVTACLQLWVQMPQDWVRNRFWPSPVSSGVSGSEVQSDWIKVLTDSCRPPQLTKVRSSLCCRRTVTSWAQGTGRSAPGAGPNSSRR